MRLRAPTVVLALGVAVTRLRRATPYLAVAAACAGCGPGPGAGTADVNLRVTENFGSSSLKSLQLAKVTGQETDMQLLERHFTVRTRYGGGFVESIDGHAGSSDEHDWFFYVDGVQSAKGAAEVDVHPGDHIWWDLHDWRAAQSIPAVVGSFPEPFNSGQGGGGSATRLACASVDSRACEQVSGELTGPLRSSSPRRPLAALAASGRLTVIVGSWDQIRRQAAARLLAHGPGTSGVYAMFSRDGHVLQLLDQDGAVARMLGSGTGLVAATASGSGPPTWLITGTDAAGVQAAARAFTASALDGKFADVVHGSENLNVPLT